MFVHYCTLLCGQLPRQVASCDSKSLAGHEWCEGYMSGEQGWLRMISPSWLIFLLKQATSALEESRNLTGLTSAVICPHLKMCVIIKAERPTKVVRWFTSQEHLSRCLFLLNVAVLYHRGKNTWPLSLRVKAKTLSVLLNLLTVFCFILEIWNRILLPLSSWTVSGW